MLFFWCLLKLDSLRVKLNNQTKLKMHKYWMCSLCFPRSLSIHTSHHQGFSPVWGHEWEKMNESMRSGLPGSSRARTALLSACCWYLIRRQTYWGHLTEMHYSPDTPMTDHGREVRVLIRRMAFKLSIDYKEYLMRNNTALSWNLPK